MRPVVIVAPPHYQYDTAASLNNNVPAFTAGAMLTVYNQPGPFIRTVAWVQNQLLSKSVNHAAFPNPSTPINRARAINRMRQRLEAIYGGARADMVGMIGDFCSFCELPLAGYLLAIEHVCPKSLYPTYTVWWWNFLLCCRDCNSNKGTKPSRALATIWAGGGAPTEQALRAQIIAHYYWPDADVNTYRVIRRTYWYDTHAILQVQMGAAAYSNLQNRLVSNTLDTVHGDVFSGGMLRVNRWVEVRINQNAGTLKAVRTLALTDLTLQETGRSARRTRAWLQCCTQLNTVLATTGAVPVGNPVLRTTVFNGLWTLLLNLAPATGFYSVWVDILRNHNIPVGVANPNGFANLGDWFVWDTDEDNNNNALEVFPGTDVAQVP